MLRAYFTASLFIFRFAEKLYANTLYMKLQLPFYQL